MKTTADALREARSLIEKPGTWIQNHFARDVNGEYVDSDDELAVSWCAAGACLRAAHAYGRSILSLLSYLEPGCDLTTWNDHLERTHEEVLAAFDRAIELASQGSES